MINFGSISRSGTFFIKLIISVKRLSVSGIISSVRLITAVIATLVTREEMQMLGLHQHRERY